MSSHHLDEATCFSFIVLFRRPTFNRLYHTAQEGIARLVPKDSMAASLISDITVWCTDGCEPGFMKFGRAHFIIDWDNERDRDAIDLTQVD